LVYLFSCAGKKFRQDSTLLNTNYHKNILQSTTTGYRQHTTSPQHYFQPTVTTQCLEIGNGMVLVFSPVAAFQKLMLWTQDTRTEMDRLEIGNEVSLVGPRVHDKEVHAATGHRAGKVIWIPLSNECSDERVPKEVENPGSNLFVSGIAPRMKEDELEEIFSKYGRVDKVQIMLDPHTQESRGFGFVQMNTGDEADAAKDALTGEERYGRVLTIEKARRARASISTTLAMSNNRDPHSRKVFWTSET
jgi:hypothetical protein